MRIVMIGTMVVALVGIVLLFGWAAAFIGRVWR